MNEFLTRWNNVNVTMKQPLKITYWDFRHWHQFSLRTNVSAWFEMHIYHFEKKVADWCSLRNSHDGLCFRWGSLFTWKCWLPLWFDYLTADNQLKVYVVSGISLVRSPYPLLVQFVQQLVGRVVRSICGLDHQGNAAKVCQTPNSTDSDTPITCTFILANCVKHLEGRDRQYWTAPQVQHYHRRRLYCFQLQQPFPLSHSQQILRFYSLPE